MSFCPLSAGKKKWDTTTVEVRGNGDDEVVGALRATLNPGVEVRKVATLLASSRDARRRLDVCAVVKDGGTEVAQFGGIVEVVPNVQLPLSTRGEGPEGRESGVQWEWW